MTMMVDVSDSRFPKAIALAAKASSWWKCRLVDGRKAYAVPSSADPNVRYLVNAEACTCPDFKRRQQPCKHIEAVNIHCALVRAQQPKPRRQPATGYAF